MTSLNALKHSLLQASDYVSSFLEASHFKKKRYYDKRCLLVSYSVNDLVQIKTHPRSDAIMNFNAKLANFPLVGHKDEQTPKNFNILDVLHLNYP